MREPRLAAHSGATLALAVAAALAEIAQANPVGPVVASGTAAISRPAPNVLQVVNMPGAILNWQSFSIGAGELTRFQQQSAASAVLNRVTGADPSSILGTLSSNGRVFLVNPHGIVFGRGSVIDTAGFVASTLNISDQDFLAGRLKFEGGGHGVLRNKGAIRASGDIFLVGPQIENAGAIRSDAGSVMLVAGRSVSITSPDAHGVRFTLQAPEDSAVNLGAISAANAAGLFAGTLRHSGEIHAVDVRTDAAGKVILAAQKDAIVEGGATIHADSLTGKGGSVRITGERVGLFDNATVTARGATGGGEILAGGDYQGANPDVRNAAMAHVAAGATLDASANAAGDGGRVIVWADDTARVHGSVLARGGPQGGAGGFIETSGKRFLDVSGIDVSATGQTPGTWLLDPLDIEVVAGAGAVNNGGAPTFTPGGGSSQVGADLITGQLNAGTSVTLNTNVVGADAGNITISSPIVKTATSASSLTLSANNDIAVNANITLPAGAAAMFNATAGGSFTVNNATVLAETINVTATSIGRSGAQANDLVYGRPPSSFFGSLFLQTTAGAVGSAAETVRFVNAGDASGGKWGVNTSAAGAAGDVYVRYTGQGLTFDGSSGIETAAGTAQAISLHHTGTSTIRVYSTINSNDDWTINSAGSYGFGGTTLTAKSMNVNLAGSFGRLGVYPVIPYFDTSASNGNITMTADNFDGTGAGGSQIGVGVKPGTGLVSATSTGTGVGGQGTSGSIQLMHFGGDMLTSRYNLNFTGGTAGAYMRLKAADGHLIVDSTAGFNASLNNKDALLQTLAAGKDIVFQGGTVQGGRVEVRAARNIDNLAPGTNGFVQTNAFGGPHWKLYATGGGIGLTNPVEGTGAWVGDLVSGGVGASGDINVKFNAGSGTPGIATVSTNAGSAQNINITSAASLGFAPGQPGYGGAFSTANDHYTMDVGGTMFFTMFNDTATAASFDLTVAGSAVTNACCGTSGRWISTTGALSITSTGGSIGESARYANLPASGGMTLSALNNVFVDAGANPMTLAGITTSANDSTIGVRTTNSITVNSDVTLPGSNSNAIFSAGNQFIISNATVQAANVSVTAGGNISRSGAQAEDFLFGAALVNGTLTLNSTGGAIGAPGNPIRFRSERTGIGFSATTAAPGAAGDIHLHYTGGEFNLAFAGPTVHTHAGTIQTVRLDHPSTGEISLGANITGNDNWIIDSGGSYRMSGGTLSGNSVTVNLGGRFNDNGDSLAPPQVFFDTSASNGNIALTADNFNAGFITIDSYRGVGVRPGTGIVTATSTGTGVGGQGTSGSILINHYGSDLLTSRYNLDLTSGAAGAPVRLRAIDGHLIVDDTAGFSASLNDKDVLLQTLAAGKDIIFQGGTVQGGKVGVQAMRNIDNLAPGTDGFIQTNAFSGATWTLAANGGGIGATNPVEGRADSYGSMATAGAGTAGDIRIKFNGGATPGIAEARTAAGSAQNISIDSAVGLKFSTARPGYTGLGGAIAPSSVTANDHYTINAAGSILFDNRDDSFTASTISITSGGSVLENSPSGGSMMSTTGLLAINANGGSIGGAGGLAGSAARLRGSGPKTLYGRDNIYIDAGSDPLTLTGLTTGAGTGTISLTTTAANDLILGGTTNIDDALVLNIGGNIIFPAAAEFTTSGGLTLNAPTQIASTAAVTVLGGVLGGSGAVTNAGTLDKAGAGIGDFSGGFTNTGSVNVNGGTLGFSGGYTDGGGALVLGGGTVNAPASGLTFNTGRLSGVGTVNGNLTNNGTLNVGLSPGTLSVIGNYTQGAGGVLNIELGGTTQGVNYDLLQVAGAANLGGSLVVSLFGPFVPTGGNTFDVITYASRTGNFAGMVAPAPPALSGVPNASFYRLTAAAAPPVVAFPPAARSANSIPLTSLLTSNLRVLNDSFLVRVEEDDMQAKADHGMALSCR
jgi:filamentous hemagglutinin family protein